MQGEYRGDFTRDTFQRAHHFSRVLMQQGRVQLDADWNEQTSILLHYLRTATADIIGQHGGASPNSFAVTTDTATPEDFRIGAGRYYVDGLLCEIYQRIDDAGAPVPLTYFTQPNYALDMETNAVPDTDVLVYLDVWERHVTSAHHELIREVALGGPDTATRAQIVWQIRVENQLPPGVTAPTAKLSDADWNQWTARWRPAIRGRLKAQVQKQPVSTDACVISPESRYRGTENQLYRVEIHNGRGEPAADGTPAPAPTFKWSRENSSVFFPIQKLGVSAGQTTVTLAHLGRDSSLSLQVNDWVELIDDNSGSSAPIEPLLKVAAVDPTTMVVTLAGSTPLVVDQPPKTHPMLRRWEGTGPIAESAGSLASDWLTLEDGIQIQFQPPAAAADITPYRNGDYWLIPARVATGKIEWPQLPNNQGPSAQPPHGVEHHYAPLAFLPSGPTTTPAAIIDLRRTFAPIAT